MKILITGGTSGIGKALAEHFLLQGEEVIMIGKHPEGVEDLTVKFPNRAIPIKCDVRFPEQVQSTYQTIKSNHGEIDVVILNAGVGFFGNLEDLTYEQFNLQFDTNVKGVFNWLKVILPDMKRKGQGQIIVTSSNLGIETSARASIYSGTKHAVQAMISCLRKELVGTGVKASTINPGSVNTPWFDGKDVDRSKMLNTDDVVQAFHLIVYQKETSDIERIVLLPSRR